jgi:hypothetical protein
MGLVLWELMFQLIQIHKKVIKRTKSNSLDNYAGLGFQLVAFVIALVYGGNWADSYFKTEPIFLLSGVFLAVFGVIYMLIIKFK